ncbi:MAG: pyridoxal-phosphate dependent enzyme [Tepidisphaeraceae bacterium]
MTDRAFQQCLAPACRSTFSVDEVHVACPKCGSLLDIAYDWNRLPVPKSLQYFEHRWATKGTETEGKLDFSGVWRFRELFPFFHKEEDVVTIGEGRTMLQTADLLGKQFGMKPGKLQLQYEGLNPSGSFKDNGMTAAFTHANMVGARRVACASTGNTSASLAMFASMSEMQGVVFIGSGKISFGKLSQALDYGAQTLQIKGDFDACLYRVRQIATGVPSLGIYLMNSVNPFRLEGQKSIMLPHPRSQQLGVAGLDHRPRRQPRELLGVRQVLRRAERTRADQKNPAALRRQRRRRQHAARAHTTRRRSAGTAETSITKPSTSTTANSTKPATVRSTIASAIEIGRPVNLVKSLRALDVMNGVVVQVDDETISEHRAMVARWGFGCEPASAASVAGLAQLLENGTISHDERVVCILTGHELKDPNETVKYHTGIDMKSVQDLAPKAEPHGKLSNRPTVVDDSLEAIVKALGGDPAVLKDINLDEPASMLPVKEY